MPAAPRSSSTRRPGAPKAKGAVRAKSGCYTCRIRRKKCDERPNEAGQCETCVRLRVECLGFGAKRPEWLRESRNVVDLRDRIKTFLAAQGMIKGHSGTGPRSGAHEPPTLRLAADSDTYSASSGSPPTPTLSLSAESDRHRHHTSSMRDVDWPLATYNQSGRWNSSYPVSPRYSSFPGLYPPISTALRSVSPYASGSSQGSVHDYTTYSMNSINSPNSLASPAITSSFSPLYNFFDPEYIEDPLGGGIGMCKTPTAYMPPQFVDELVNHYMKDVIDIQYILADSEIPRIIFDSVSRRESSEHAVKLLAYVHAKRFRQPEVPTLRVYDLETYERMTHLRTLLSQQDLITEDAMAALHVVSSILFDGGQGAWKEWLHVANTYVDNLFLRYHGPADALLNCDAKDAFVVKTAVWFDVLASVTTQKSPHFLEAIRAMFDPNRSGICDAASLTPPQYSMMSPMGCENHVVWALAETSELSVWKREHSRAGSLSVPELVHKASFIETYLTPPPMITDLPCDERACSRQLASEVFRASARLYLRSVVSGDYPDVPEIKESVTDTLEAIGRIPISTYEPTIARSVVRSTVFSFFICGALAEESQRDIIKQQLEREMCERVGNCSSIQTLLNKLWDGRPRNPTRRGPNLPVEWRELLKGSDMLLV